MAVGSCASFIFLFLLCTVPVQMQRRNVSPSVAVVLPPGLHSSKPNTLSVAVSENADVDIKVSDGSISLLNRTFEVLGGRPANLTIGPFTVSPSSYLVRVDVKRSFRGSTFYTQTFHLPRVSAISEASLEMEKSFYRPMEIVRFRVLPLGSDYRVSSTPLTVLIQNPTELIVWRETLTASDDKPFAKSSFQLPQHLAEGQWKILVRDATTNTQLTERKFQVLRYDLPKFEILVVANTSYYATGKENVEVLVLARLATGRPVSGTLIVTCSSMVLSNGLITSSRIEDGNATVSFNLQTCWQPAAAYAPSDVTIRADVRDFGSGEKHFSTVKLPLRPKPYSLKLLPLKPGLTNGRLDSSLTASTPILVSIHHPNGRPAESVPVTGSMDCIQQRNRMERVHSNKSFGSTNTNGELLINLSLRQKCVALMTQISTNDPELTESQQNTQRLLLPLFVADAISLLGLDKFQYQVGETMAIRIQRMESIGQDIALRLLVVSQSTIVAHFPVTTDTVRLQVISEMLPEFALILYQASNNSSTVIVDDVARILVSYGCKRDKTTLRLEDPDQPSIRQSSFHPGSRATLFLQSAQGAFVATKAIDKRLEQLSRQFHLFEQNAIGISRKSDVFEKLFDGNKTMDGFDLVPKRDIAASMCCAAGRVWWQLNEDCADLRSDLPYLKDCHQEFVTCCSHTDLPVSDPACQRGQSCRHIVLAGAGRLNSRMHQPKTLFAAVPAPSPVAEFGSELIRRHFPEVWMFDEYTLGQDSTLATPITLPHSITNWTLTGRFWAPSSPVCPAQTEIGIEMSTYMEIDLPETVYVGDQMLTKVIIYNFESSEKRVTLNATKPKGLCTSTSSSVDWHLTLNASSTAVVTVPFEFMRNDRYEIVFTLTEFLGHSRQKQLDQVVKEVYAMARETIDSSLEYNFSWDLGAGDNVNKWINDTVLSYNFVRFRDDESSEINASLYLTDAVMANLKISKMIVQFTPLPAAKRARWSKLKLANDTWRDFVTATSLNDLLIRAPSALQAMEDSRDSDQSIPNPLLIQSSQLLHLCQMETLSFRTRRGAYSPFRIKEPAADTVPVSIWLTALTTALHCRTHMDISVVCPSLSWLTEQQNGDGSFTASDSADFTTLKNQTDNAVILTSFTLLTMRVCANYGNKCSTDDSKKRIAVRKALGFMANVDTKKSDPLVLGAVALTFAAWKYPFARPENDALLKLLEEGSDYPYWTYRRATNGFWDKVKHGAKGWFSAEYRNKMLSCQISLNAMGLMTQLLLGNPKRLNLEQIGLWLIENRRRDGTFIRLLDTLLASRAIHELQRSMIDRDQSMVTRISVQCETSGGCPSLDITPQNAELTQSMNLNIDARGVTFLVTGRGAVYVKFQLIGSPPLRNSNFYPVQLLANTSADSPTLFVHDMCFTSSEDSIKTISIEHAFGSGLSYVAGTFAMTKGNATNFPPESTSHSVHILFSEVKKKVDYCYTYQTKKALGQPIFSLRRPIIARHPSLGIVGMTLSAGQNQGSQIPLLEKYCPKNSDDCICAEAACPPPQAECSTDMCTPQHVKNLMKALCNPDNAGCVVKAIGQEEENTGRTVYKRFVTSKHFALTPNSTEDECKDLDVLIRGNCPCPRLFRNDYYVLVVRRDALLEPNVKGFRPTVLAGEHGFFEPYFACSDNRQSDIHKLVQEDLRRKICANLT